MLSWDFDSIQARLINRLRSKTSWATVLPESTNARLLDSFAEEFADLANYGEYNTRENTWTLARNRSSLLAVEAIHRYNAYRKIGASGTIRVAVSDAIQSQDWIDTSSYNTDDIVYYNDVLYTSLTDSNIGNTPSSSPSNWELTDIKPLDTLDIPQWSVFGDESGTYKFTTYSANFLSTSENFTDVNVIQGTPQSYTYIVNDLVTENLEITIDTPNIENTYYEVWVNDVLWTEVDSLLDASGTATNYETEDSIDFQKLYLKFGNDTYGKKLSFGDEVVFRYISTLGVAGNINSTNIIVKVVSTLRYSGGSVASAECTNIDPLSGGKNEEDIESIRNNAPKIFESGERASNYDDYKAIILNNFSFTSKVAVWGSYEISIDAGQNPWEFDPTQENVVHVGVVSSSYENLTNQQKYNISSGINAYKSPTDIVVYEDIRFVNIIFNTVAYVSNTTYTLSGVVGNIRSALIDAYDVSKMDIYENIYFSDYQTLIDQVAGVEHHTTYAEIYYDSTFNLPTTSIYYADLVIPSITLRQGSVEVWLKDSGESDAFFLIGTDNSSNGFDFVVSTEFTSLDLTGSSINLSTGAMALVVDGLTNPYTNYTIRVFYRLSQDDLVLQKRYDIFAYQDAESTNITAQYIRR